jgi:serine/threonine protein kinase
MKSLKFHPNLVCMLGYVHDDTNPLLVLELCANGDLLQFLRKNKENFAKVHNRKFVKSLLLLGS